MMRRFYALVACAVVSASAFAQTLNIQTGSVITAVPASQAGDMTYSDSGQSLTVCGKTFTVGDISQIFIDDSEVTDNTVGITYSGTSASVVVAGNVAQYLTVSVSGADVTIAQSESLTDEVTYTLSGSSTNGSFSMDGKLKATVVLNGVTLTSTTQGAINITNGKRINIEAADGTTNTFTDATSGSQKACFFVKGHAEFSGSGTISITGNAKHAYRSNEYTQLKKSFGTLNILGAASDGLHIEQYLKVNGGTINVSGVSSDGIDVSATDDATDEQNGEIIVNGGTINVATTADDVKSMKADAAITISDGTLTLTAAGNGSKGLSTNSTLSITGGRVEVVTTGGIYAENTDAESKPNGVKADGNLTISGGEVYVAAMQKAFNTDATFAINGGTVMGIGSKNSSTNEGTQDSTVYKNVNVTAGSTVSYDGVSYTVPSTYSCSSAKVLVSNGN